MKCGSVERALGYLNRAIELDPVNEIPWVVRSECFTRSESYESRSYNLWHARLERCKEAIEDADYALHLNPESFKAIIAHGNALYGMGEFEKGLVVFQRGWRRRMDSKMKSGMQKCKIAIENAVGPHSRQFDVGLVESVMKEMEKEKLPKPDRAALEAAKLQEACKSKEKKKQERSRRERRRKKLDKILLGKVAEDCSFLRGLAKVDREAEEGDISEYQVGMLLLSVMMIRIF